MKQNKVLKIVLLVALVVIVGVGSFFAGQLVSNSSSDKRAQAELKEKVEEVLASKIRLQCDENGEFKVTVLADVHASGTIDLNVQNDIKKIIDTEQPDLVLFTGDNAICANEQKLREALDSMVGYIEQQQIPWCHVYGNHDQEGGLSKEELQAIYESYEYCVSKRGDENLTGVGNYVLPVYEYESDTISHLIWCLDSGSMLSTEDQKAMLPISKPDFSGIDYSAWGGYYDYIHADQIQWYYQTSLMLEEYFLGPIPGIMAFHMPLQEIYYAWQNKNALDKWDGEKNDPVGASPINSGLFTTLTQRGDVVATVSGHDHMNSYMVEYKGVMLSYSPGCSTHGYGSTETRGSRSFTMNSADPWNVETHVFYLNR